MKKLNKKGFTLVELLAVIVILAVIMVITIPTVLGSMSSAKDSAAQNAIAAIQKYIDDQTELCKAGLGSVAPAETSIFVDTSSCLIDTSAVDTIIKNAGYEKEFSAITFKTETVNSDTCTEIPAGGAKPDGTDSCTTTGGKSGYYAKVTKQTNNIATVKGKTGGQFGDETKEITAK